jgi:opacity protein-like surface antigen
MKAILVIAMSLVSFSASANYFKAGLGFNVGGEVEYTDPTGTSKGDWDNTFMTPLLLAYGFDMMGDVYGEVELGYRKHEIKDIGGATVINEPTFLTGAFNIVGNAPMGAVTLTGGAGAFFGQYDSDSALDSGTGFGLQVFGGVDFAVNEAMTIGGELRYMTTVSDIGLEFDNDASYSSTSVLINAKFGM